MERKPKTFNNNFVVENQREVSELSELDKSQIALNKSKLEVQNKYEQVDNQRNQDIFELERLNTGRLKELLAFELGREGKDLLKNGLRAFFGSKYGEFDRAIANLAVLNQALPDEFSTDLKRLFQSWESWISDQENKTPTEQSKRRLVSLKNALEKKRPISSIFNLLSDFLSNSGVGIEDVKKSFKILTNQNTFSCLVLILNFGTLTDSLTKQKDLLLSIWLKCITNLRIDKKVNALNVVKQIKLIQFSDLIRKIQDKQSLAISIANLALFESEEVDSDLRNETKAQVKELVSFVTSGRGLTGTNCHVIGNISEDKLEHLVELTQSKEEALGRIAIAEIEFLRLNCFTVEFIETLFKNSSNSKTCFSSFLSRIKSLGARIEAKLEEHNIKINSNEEEIDREFNESDGTAQILNYVVSQSKSSPELKINFLLSALEESSHRVGCLILDQVHLLVQNYRSNLSLKSLELNALVQFLLESSFNFLKSNTQEKKSQIEVQAMLKSLKLVKILIENNKLSPLMNCLQAFITEKHQIYFPVQIGSHLFSTSKSIFELIEAFLFALIQLSTTVESENVVRVIGEVLKLVNLALQGVSNEELNAFIDKFISYLTPLSLSQRITYSLTSIFLNIHFDPRITENNLHKLNKYIEIDCLERNINTFIRKNAESQDSSQLIKQLNSAYKSFVDTEEFEAAFYSYVYLNKRLNYQFKGNLKETVGFFRQIALSIQIKIQDNAVIVHFPKESIISEVNCCHKREFVNEIEDSNEDTVRKELVLASLYLGNTETVWCSEYSKVIWTNILHYACFLPTIFGIIVVILEYMEKIEDGTNLMYGVIGLQILLQLILLWLSYKSLSKKDFDMCKFEEVEKNKFLNLKWYVFIFMILTGLLSQASKIYNVLKAFYFFQMVGIFLPFKWFERLVKSITVQILFLLLVGAALCAVAVIFFGIAVDKSVYTALILLGSVIVFPALREVKPRDYCLICRKKFNPLSIHLKENHHSLFGYISFLLRVNRKKNTLTRWLELFVRERNAQGRDWMVTIGT